MTFTDTYKLFRLCNPYFEELKDIFEKVFQLISIWMEFPLLSLSKITTL